MPAQRVSSDFHRFKNQLDLFRKNNSKITQQLLDPILQANTETRSIDLSNLANVQHTILLDCKVHQTVA